MRTIAVPGFISARRDELGRLCQQFHVARLDLFGSALSDAFEAERSDLDFLVEFESEYAQQRFDDYFGLREALTELLSRPVDLVVRRAMKNPLLIREIEANSQQIYAA